MMLPHISFRRATKPCTRPTLQCRAMACDKTLSGFTLYHELHYARRSKSRCAHHTHINTAIDADYGHYAAAASILGHMPICAILLDTPIFACFLRRVMRCQRDFAYAADDDALFAELPPAVVPPLFTYRQQSWVAMYRLPLFRRERATLIRELIIAMTPRHYLIYVPH